MPERGAQRLPGVVRTVVGRGILGWLPRVGGRAGINETESGVRAGDRAAQQSHAIRAAAASGGGPGAGGVAVRAAAELIELAAARAGGGGVGGLRWLSQRLGLGRGAASVPPVIEALGLALPAMGPEAFEAAWAVGAEGGGGAGAGGGGWWAELAERWLVMGSGGADERRAGLVIAGRLGASGSGGDVRVKLAKAVAAALDGVDAVEDARAESVLAAMVAGAERRGDEAECRVVGEAVASALERIERHRRGGLVVLAARMWARGGPEPTWLADAGHPGQMVLRSALRRDGHAALLAAAWGWMKHEPVRSAAVARVLAQPCADGTDAKAAGRRRGALATWHLVHHPRRAAALAGAGRAGGAEGGVLLTARGLAGRSVDERRAYAQWLARAPLPASRRDAGWGMLLVESDASVRHGVARAASGIGAAMAAGRGAARGVSGGGATGRRPAVLLDLCFDREASVAATAAGLLLLAPGREAMPATERMALARRLARSPHTSVREIAGALLAAGSAAGLRSVGEVADIAELITGDDAADAARIIELRAGAALGRLGAVVIAGLAEFVREGAAAGEARSPRSVSAAVTVLGAAAGSAGAAGGGVGEVLLLAAKASDARVRANAVDAMVRRGRSLAMMGAVGASAGDAPGGIGVVRSALLAAGADESHRVRGSAARGLLLAGEESAQPGLARAGRRVLLELLDAGDEATRGAGLWVSRRLAGVVATAPEVVDRVRMIEMKAVEPGERVRSVETVERLMEAVRGQWAGRARAMDVA